MAVVNGEWDGVCACGKAESDGVQCKLGATHQPRTPWATKSETTMETEVTLPPWMQPRMPWQ